MSEQLVKRLRELSNAVTRADWNEFSMRIPVEKDRDADFVLLQAADKIADLEAAEEGAKIAFGDVVDQKHALTKRCKSLEASIAAMRDIISTQAARIAALEADAARMNWIQSNALCADFEYKHNGYNMPVVCIQWPKNVGVSGNLRASIDAAMQTKP